jgi:hypothetical protein
MCFLRFKDTWKEQLNLYLVLCLIFLNGMQLHFCWVTLLTPILQLSHSMASKSHVFRHLTIIHQQHGTWPHKCSDFFCHNVNFLRGTRPPLCVWSIFSQLLRPFDLQYFGAFLNLSSRLNSDHAVILRSSST